MGLLNHYIVHLKLIYHCMLIILKLKKIFKLYISECVQFKLMLFKDQLYLLQDLW